MSFYHKFLAFMLGSLACINSTQAATNLFFTEYTEYENNDALEIFNNSKQSIDLSQYQIAIYANGSLVPNDPLDLQGMIQPGEALVYSHHFADSELLQRNTANQRSNRIAFDGNDAVALRKKVGNTIEIIDFIGQIGKHQVWGNGNTQTFAHTLRRKAHIEQGDCNPNDVFIPSDQWLGFPSNTFYHFGEHQVVPLAHNNPPQAQAGDDQVVTANDTVQLNGSHSSDQESAIINYQWEQLKGATVTLNKNNSNQAANPSFIAPQVTKTEVLQFRLTVMDSLGETHSDTVDIQVIPPSACHATAHFISTIQGETDQSLFVGQTVTVKGIVTKKLSGYQGFVLQEESHEQDALTSTSEALFVQNSSILSSISKGDLVAVTGIVNEVDGLTQLENISQYEVCSYNHSTKPIHIQLPLTESEREAYESMLVSINQKLTVTNTNVLTQLGQFTVSANGRLFKGTQIEEKGSKAQAITANNQSQQLVIDDGQADHDLSQQYPTPLNILGFGTVTYEHPIRAGFELNQMTGILHYATHQLNPQQSQAGFKLIPTESINLIASNPRSQYITPPRFEGNISVASIHAENFFTTLNSDNPICAPAANRDCLGANNLDAFIRQKNKLLSSIIQIEADVLALIGVENHATDHAINDIINGLNIILGKHRYVAIETGALGHKSTKVALLYNLDTVKPVGNFDIVEYGDDMTQPSLVQTFHPKNKTHTDNHFTVAVNHFPSKQTICLNLNDPDQGDGQGHCNLTRTTSANVLLMKLIESNKPKPLIIGALNAYSQEDPIWALTESGYKDLSAHYVDAPTRYSYQNHGEWGVLNHALASPSLSKHVTGAGFWHINSDEPIGFNYISSHRPYQSNEVFRSSSHDPIIVGLNLVKEEQMTTPQDGEPDPEPPIPPVIAPTNPSTPPSISSGGGSMPWLFIVFIGLALKRLAKPTLY